MQRYLIIVSLVAALALNGCSAASGAPAEPEAGATYDNECRVREYGETLSMEEYNTFPDKMAKHIVDEDMTMDEALEAEGVPYYEMCLIHRGLGSGREGR